LAKEDSFTPRTSVPGTDPSKSVGNNVLVGEPEFYVYPTPNVSPPEVQGFHDYINAYPHHHAVRLAYMHKYTHEKEIDRQIGIRTVTDGKMDIQTERQTADGQTGGLADWQAGRLADWQTL
jgi:hypothetical protein